MLTQEQFNDTKGVIRHCKL